MTSNAEKNTGPATKRENRGKLFSLDHILFWAHTVQDSVPKIYVSVTQNLPKGVLQAL